MPSLADSACCRSLRQAQALPAVASVWEAVVCQGVNSTHPSGRQQRERKHSPRGAHDLIALPWAGKEANGELVLPSLQPMLFSHDAGIGVGDNGTSSTSLSPGSCHLEFSGLKGEHRPWTDKLVPGLTYQFGENLDTFNHLPALS